MLPIDIEYEFRFLRDRLARKDTIIADLRDYLRQISQAPDLDEAKATALIALAGRDPHLDAVRGVDSEK